MKKIISFVTVMLLSIVCVFALSACEKSLSGIYEHEDSGLKIEFASKTRCFLIIDNMEDKISAEYEIEKDDGEWVISIEPNAEKYEQFEIEDALFSQGEDSNGEYIEIDGEKFYLVD